MDKGINKYNPIILSTDIYGYAYQKEPNYINNILEFYAGQNDLIDLIDGVELNIRTPGIIEEFQLSKRSIEFIQSLDHNTLHYFNFSLFDFKQDRLLSSRDLTHIGKLKSINDTFHFKSIVLHPFPYCESEVRKLYEIFHDELGIPVFNFESMIRDKDIGKNDFETLFVDKKIGLLLDVSHAVTAYTNDSLYTFEYVRPLFDRISYLHISSVRRDLAYRNNAGFFCPSKCHTMFTETNSEDLKLFDQLFELIQQKEFLGFILEQCITVKDIKPLREEINFIKKHFLQS
ncbi:MAG: hypothetical protein HQK89_01545 [Nitrospirae bacterium]|nr:hypothetical protein [Nitrospirota bacterium]